MPSHGYIRIEECTHLWYGQLVTGAQQWQGKHASEWYVLDPSDVHGTFNPAFLGRVQAHSSSSDGVKVPDAAFFDIIKIKYNNHRFQVLFDQPPRTPGHGQWQFVSKDHIGIREEYKEDILQNAIALSMDATRLNRGIPVPPGSRSKSTGRKPSAPVPLQRTDSMCMARSATRVTCRHHTPRVGSDGHMNSTGEDAVLSGNFANRDSVPIRDGIGTSGIQQCPDEPFQLCTDMPPGCSDVPVHDAVRGAPVPFQRSGDSCLVCSVANLYPDRFHGLLSHLAKRENRMKLLYFKDVEKWLQRERGIRLQRVKRGALLKWVLAKKSQRYIALVYLKIRSGQHVIAIDCDKGTISESDPTFPNELPLTRTSFDTIGVTAIQKLYRVVAIDT